MVRNSIKYSEQILAEAHFALFQMTPMKRILPPKLLQQEQRREAGELPLPQGSARATQAAARRPFRRRHLSPARSRRNI